jgi:biopolymer transport protein ExbB
MFRHLTQWTLLVVAVALVLGASSLFAQTEGTDEEQKEISLWSVIHSGGVIGYLILLMSVVAVAFIVEHFITIRRAKILPPALVAQLEEHIAKKEYAPAQQACATDGSFLAEIVAAGLNQIGSMFGFFDMQSAMQEVSERQVSRLYRKLEYLSFIAATGPMLGLLGTVTGMIRAFNKIAFTEGAAKPSELAGGISEALVTTCLGLVLAIPVMFFVAFFRTRIDDCVAEAETVVERLMGRFRKGSQD